MTRVLGIDLGLKRTGLAMSDELGLSVRALPNLAPKSRAEDVNVILGLCQTHDVGVVVVGYALLASGEESMMAKRARGFRDALISEAQARGLSLQFILQDESGTSKAAVLRLTEMDLPKNKRRARVDAEAACILVEDYLNSQKDKSL